MKNMPLGYRWHTCKEDAEAVLETVQSLINDTPDYILSDPFVHYLLA